MDIPNITKEELVALKKKAYRSFYLRPRYILKKLSEIRQKMRFYKSKMSRDYKHHPNPIG